ncbi:LysR family transcriptional regulator [Vibrio harveyi]|uniref:LysR family transcriptional regulator n=3 Tax=Vibrio harveyi group TaxID=717610 RepID=UPI00390BC010
MIKMNNQIVSFAFVCKYLSITKAAMKLGKSKAHISRHILELEKEVGVKLFYRTTRSISLTPYGEVLQTTALELLDNINLLSYKMSSLNDSMIGEFKITMPVSIAMYIFPDILKKLKTTFPDVKFQIIATNNKEDLICENIDMAIRLDNIGDDSLIAHKVGTYTKVLAKKINGDKATLIKYRHDEEYMARGYENIIDVDNITILKEYIDSGIGEGFLPSYSINDKDDFMIDNQNKKCSDVYIAYPYQSPLPKKLVNISEIITYEIKNSIK